MMNPTASTKADEEDLETADPRIGHAPWSTPSQRVLIVLLAVLALGVALFTFARFDPRPAASGSPAFGERPPSSPVTCQNTDSVTFSGNTYRKIDDQQPAITIEGCKHVIIEDNDFIDVAEPIYVHGSTDVVIRNNRYRNITGPHERDGSHRGNFTQWDDSFGGEISGNVGIGGDTEDVISIYHSGGTDAENPLLIRDNHFQGTDWTSSSGSGILVGDGGGSHVVVRDNVLVNIGQVGIGVAGGSDIRVEGNTVLGERRAGSNVGIYAWAQGGASCSDVEIRDNDVDFAKADGTPSPIYAAPNCGPIDVSSNDFSAKLDPDALRVKL